MSFELRDENMSPCVQQAFGEFLLTWGRRTVTQSDVAGVEPGIDKSHVIF